MPACSQIYPFFAQVVPSLLLKKKQASLPDSHEVNTNQDAAREESPLEVNPSDSSDSELENSGPAADGEVAWVCLRYVCECVQV